MDLRSLGVVSCGNRVGITSAVYSYIIPHSQSEYVFNKKRNKKSFLYEKCIGNGGKGCERY